MPLALAAVRGGDAVPRNDRPSASPGTGGVRWVLRMLAAATLALAAGCTDPTAIGPTPQFVGVGSISSFDGFDGPGQLVGLPPDSCPTLPAPPTGAVRRALGDEPATLLLPPDMLGATARFASTPGVVFNAPDIGFVAVSYGDQQPILYTRNTQDVRNPRSIYVNFERTCRLTVNDRPAQLLLSFIVVGTSAPTGIVYGRAMMLRTQSPTGRRVNLLVALHAVGPTDVQVYNARLLALAGVAASLQW